MRAFRGSKLKLDFHPLLLQVPNWESIITPCIDPSFSSGFKRESTQHQCKIAVNYCELKTLLFFEIVYMVLLLYVGSFEAVEVSVYFPLGAKTCYKRNASEWVIEFEFKDPDQCISPIGRHTGMEPILVQSIWHPTKDLNPDRPVEGFYILRAIPNVNNIPPAPFHKQHPERALESLTAVRHSIKSSSLFKLMGIHASKRAWWENWFRFIPESLDPVQYRAQLEREGVLYLEPLKEYVYRDTYKAEWSGSWNLGTGMDVIIGRGYNLPEIIAIGGNCVRTEFNPNPVHPRLFSMRDELLQAELKQYQLDYEAEFEILLGSRTMSNAMFRPLIQRKVSYDCKFINMGKIFVLVNHFCFVAAMLL